MEEITKHTHFVVAPAMLESVHPFTGECHCKSIKLRKKEIARAAVTSPHMEILLMYAEAGVNTKRELSILFAITDDQDPTQY